MGLYESELSRQIHLRSRQKKEWQMLRKKMEAEANSRHVIPEQVEKEIQEEKRKDDQRELAETATSKQLAAAMMRSSTANDDETLHKCADLLNNQNGKDLGFFLLFHELFKDTLTLKSIVYFNGLFKDQSIFLCISYKCCSCC